MNKNKANPPLSKLQQKAIEWIRKKSANKGCEFCGQNHWTVPEDTVTPVVLKSNSLQLGGSSYSSINYK